MIIAYLVHPGAGLNIDPATLHSNKVAKYVEKACDSPIVGFLMDIIPNTIVKPAH